MTCDATSADAPSPGPKATSRPVPAHTLVEMAAEAPARANAGHDRRGSSTAGRRGSASPRQVRPMRGIARPPPGAPSRLDCERHPGKAREMIERVAHQLSVATERGKN